MKNMVKFANDNTLAVEGVGDVLIMRKDGKRSVISYVLYIPGMKSNLLNIGQLVEKNYKVSIEYKMMRVLESNVLDNSRFSFVQELMVFSWYEDHMIIILSLYELEVHFEANSPSDKGSSSSGIVKIRADPKLEHEHGSFKLSWIQGDSIAISYTKLQDTSRGEDLDVLEA
ncbi:hypothetical protein KIW84_057522 [Lathyrus oleraceus]|uniref:Retrovirus-related Pol polyprotein from transposon TNT 1-94-like beta-barrel domain-containing protein n=1 Tax=Pisum sativum TaxID=3888 RepID=A0A9D5AIC2_PEA|nr:hypothetical protein KIW84_057522 [Pisum sativum]